MAENIGDKMFSSAFFCFFLFFQFFKPSKTFCKQILAGGEAATIPTTSPLQMSLPCVVQVSLHLHLVIINYSASSALKGLLCFIRKGQQPLVIVPGLCVYSSVMPWHLCNAPSQAIRRRQHQPARRPQVRQGRLCPHMGFDSQRQTWHSRPVVLSCPQ